MIPHNTTSAVPEITVLELDRVTGGAALDFAAVRQEAQAYCPKTAARYASVSPGSVTRPVAQRMGNECLAEMGPFQATFARGPITTAIDQAFPAR